MNNTQCILDALKIATDTKAFELGEGVLHRAPALFKEYFPNRKAVIVADNNTWKAAGEAVDASMREAGIPCERFLIEEEEFHADWPYVERIDEMLDRTGAVAVAVGSGVINDLCKLASFHHGQSYLCVATAASVDGYSSSGAVVSRDGAKLNIETHAPLVILADVGVLAAAPKEMTAAGYADLAAKIPAGAEWMIADLFGTEPIIPAAWNVFMNDLDAMLADPEGVAAGKPEAIASLFAGLTLSGIAMQVAKSSRPASCTEHLFSHVLDMTHHRYNGKFQSHGFQVAIGTLTMCAFFDEFFKMDLSTLGGRMALARSGAAACARSVPRFPRAGAGLYRDHEEVERCRDGSRTTHASQGELARLQGAVAGAVLSVREDACAVRRRGCADRSFADRCFARAVAQHGRFYAVVALAHQSARSGQTRTDLR